MVLFHCLCSILRPLEMEQDHLRCNNKRQNGPTWFEDGQLWSRMRTRKMFTIFILYVDIITVFAAGVERKDVVVWRMEQRVRACAVCLIRTQTGHWGMKPSRRAILVDGACRTFSFSHFQNNNKTISLVTRKTRITIPVKRVSPFFILLLHLVNKTNKGPRSLVSTDSSVYDVHTTLWWWSFFLLSLSSRK